MSIIKILPDNVSNKIAAGEVIERPASVVKELVENSIDAGAERIIINIEKSGKKLIAVTDDGCGMDSDDALLSLEAHATSKIREDKDINKIMTMGFRGEALPSIASVSKLKLRTRQRVSTVGTELIVNGGRFIKENPVGCAPGTEIIVNDLFFNIPARKKFLKSDATEEKHIYEMVCLLAMVNYNIAFELIIDGRTVIASPGNKEILPRICDFLGRGIGEKLISINAQTGDIKISGYVSKPGLVRNSRRDQRVFINKRPIRTMVVYSAISEAYNTMIMKGTFPIAVICIDIPAEKIDINVHPAKHEVRFQNPNVVKESVCNSIRDALRKAVKPVGTVKKMNVPFTSILANAQIDYSSRIQGGAESKDLTLFNFSIESDIDSKEITEVTEKNGKVNTEEINPEIKDKLTKNRIDVLQRNETELHSRQINFQGCDDISFIDIINNTYILCRFAEGLIIIDQHAAHERVLFEKLLNEENENIISQKLLFPITIELSLHEYSFLLRNTNYFNKLGFELDDFGNNTVIVAAVPVNFPMNNISGLISDMIEDIITENNSKNINEHIIARTACRFAVKANDVLSKLEAEELLKDLSKCRLPFSCPHGRPTIINISFKELEKRFGRKL